MKKHELFSNYVVKSDSSDEATKIGWYENDYFDKNSLVLPVEIFQSNECKLEFENYVKYLKDMNRKIEHKCDLSCLLHASASKNCIQPGKQLNEVNVYLIGRECYESLNEEERRLVYEQFQKEISEKAKLEFKELLNENCEYFLDNILNRNPTHSDIDELMKSLKLYFI